MLSQGGHDHPQLYLEIIRVYLQLLGVQHTQVFECVLDVIQVLHSFFQTAHDNFSVSRHFGVRCYCISAGEVSKFTKIPLSPGVDGVNNQSSGLRSDLSHINLSPQAGDGAALGICPLNHGDGVKVSSDFSQTNSLIKDLSVRRLDEAGIY
uniref:Uncharacterized protein n=1 Tax=Kryptolebias marmoratus TaxID=37003 RepID=A0A3Q3B4E1_KRYMA